MLDEEVEDVAVDQCDFWTAPAASCTPRCPRQELAPNATTRSAGSMRGAHDCCVPL